MNTFCPLKCDICDPLFIQNNTISWKCSKDEGILSASPQVDIRINCATDTGCPFQKIFTYFKRGKYHYTTDLIFDWFGFSCFAYIGLIENRFTCLVESKPVKQEVSRKVILPLTYKVSECYLPFLTASNFNLLGITNVCHSLGTAWLEVCSSNPFISN